MFGLAALSILGLAWLIGQATERLGAITGPQVGGILNATFGNIAELIIAFFALQAGLIDVVKASLTGSIIGNLLLVLGLSVLVGGIRNGRQTFSREIAGSNAALLVLAAIGLLIPAVLAFSSVDERRAASIEDSVLVVGLPDRGLRPVADLPVHEPGRDPRRPRAARRPRGARLDAAGGRGRPRRGGGPARDPVRDPRRRDRAGRRQFGLTTFFVGVVDPAGDRQPRRAARRGPARLEEPDGVLDGRVVRREPPGRPVRRAGPRPPRRR